MKILPPIKTWLKPEYNLLKGWWGNPINWQNTRNLAGNYYQQTTLNRCVRSTANGWGWLKVAPKRVKEFGNNYILSPIKNTGSDISNELSRRKSNAKRWWKNYSSWEYTKSNSIAYKAYDRTKDFLGDVIDAVFPHKQNLSFEEKKAPSKSTSHAVNKPKFSEILLHPRKNWKHWKLPHFGTAGGITIGLTGAIYGVYHWQYGTVFSPQQQGA